MPVCPNCNYEYVPGIAICPDCNIPLVDSIELEKYSELSEKDWVLVYTAFNEIDADMLKENLESAGIAASILSQKDSSFPAPGDLSTIKLFVKRHKRFRFKMVCFCNEHKKFRPVRIRVCPQIRSCLK